MKKFFALVLALVMMTALSVPAFAAEGAGTASVSGPALSNKEITVQGTYVLGNSDATYSIEITWTGMAFTFTADSEWNVGQGKDVPVQAGTGSWSAPGTITITSKSNRQVTAVLSWAGVGGIGGQFGKTTLTTAAASGVNATTDSTTFQPTGNMAANADSTIGTITITLS